MRKKKVCYLGQIILLEVILTKLLVCFHGNVWKDPLVFFTQRNANGSISEFKGHAKDLN